MVLTYRRSWHVGVSLEASYYELRVTFIDGMSLCNWYVYLSASLYLATAHHLPTPNLPRLSLLPRVTQPAHHTIYCAINVDNSILRLWKGFRYCY